MTKVIPQQVFIIRKFNQEIFLGLPMTSAQKEGAFYQKLQHGGRDYTVVLSQIRLFDRKRLQRKLRILSKKEFENILRRFKEIL